MAHLKNEGCLTFYVTFLRVYKYHSLLVVPSISITKMQAVI